MFQGPAPGRGLDPLKTSPVDVELIEIRDFLAGLPPFAELPKDALARLPREISVRYLRRATPFPPADADQPYLYVLRSGAIELRDANDQLIDKFGEGELYACPAEEVGQAPELALHGTVVEDSLFYLLPCTLVRQLRAAHERFDRYFSVSVRERLRHALEVLQDTRTASGLTRARVADLLHRKPATIAPNLSIQEAARVMSEESVSALLVSEGERLAGLITDHDLRTRCIARGLPYDRPVSEIMTRDLLTIAHDAPAFEALLIMTQRDIHHLPVLRSGALAGVISSTDLIRYQSTNAAYLARDVRRAESVEAMAQLSARLPELHVQLVASGVTAQQSGETLSSVVDAMTVRLIELAQQTLGEPPVPFVWLAVGSQARREQTAHSDQDNALLLDDAYRPERHADHFERLARFVNDGLNACGIPYCPGNVMASNPQWRQPLTAWKRYFHGWIDRPDRRSAMLSSNFFDMRCVHGDESLFERLRADILPRARDNKIFIAYMASDALQNRPPLGFFRNLVLIGEGDHANTFDLKHRGIIPIVDLARVHALSSGLSEVGTRARLQAAAGSSALSREGAANLEDALEFLASLRARHQAAQIKRGETPDNYVEPDELSPLERNHLKDAFEVIVTVQKTLAQRYQVGRLV